MNILNLAGFIAGIIVTTATAAAGITGKAEAVESAEKIQVGTGRVLITFSSGRRFFLTDQTTITQRGIAVDAEQFIQVGTGRIGRFTVAADVNDTISSGTLLDIEFGPQMVGPITSVAPLTVFNFPLTLTAGTLLDDVPGNDIANLQVGDDVVISGFSNAAGQIQVTELEFEEDPLDEWVITGPVTAVTAQRFSIGNQSILINGIEPDDCDGVLTVGRLVQVEATPDPAFVLGAELTTAVDIDCEIDQLVGDPGAIVPAFIEGFVTTVGMDDTFVVGGQTVSITASTQFDDGDPIDIVVGVRVEVEGFLDTDSGVLTATEIDFEALRFEARGPVNPEDIGAGSIELFGLTVITTPQTKDEDNVLTGISSPIQLDVRAFIDSDGTIYADEVKDEGDPDVNDVSLRGVVGAISRPQVEVQGITIDTSTSVIELDDEEGGGVIDQDTFYSMLQPGAEIEIDNAQYDVITNVLSGGNIEIEFDNQAEKQAIEVMARSATKGMNDFGVGLGVIVESGDQVFSSDFDL